ncbi:MAG: OmpH family outer membrane protein [Kangiellaceae bacterium]|nr:OmpH family outer membrane protein [Kangiellaceae bacterium]
MKKLFSFLIAATIGMSSAYAEGLKIGYVDVQYIMSKAPQRVAIAEKIKAEFREQNEELQKIYADIMKMQDDVKKNGTTMTEQQRLDIGRKAQQMEANFKIKQQAINEDSQRRAQEEQQILGTKILEKIAEYSKANQYDMIVNKSALLWAADAQNVSDQILGLLSSAGN